MVGPEMRCLWSFQTACISTSWHTRRSTRQSPFALTASLQRVWRLGSPNLHSAGFLCPQVLRELREETAKKHEGRERNQVAPEQGRFLGWLLGTLGARRAIELGTFTGYSSLCLALVSSTAEPLLCFPSALLSSSVHAAYSA